MHEVNTKLLAVGDDIDSGIFLVCQPLGCSAFLRPGERLTFEVKPAEVEEVYSVACEEYDERPRAHTQFWNYLKDFVSYEA